MFHLAFFLLSLAESWFFAKKGGFSGLVGVSFGMWQKGFCLTKIVRYLRLLVQVLFGVCLKDREQQEYARICA